MEKKHKGQPCWSCQNAYANKCCWFRDFTPVEGWGATPSICDKVNYDGNIKLVHSFEIHSCPNYVSDKIKTRKKKTMKRLPKSTG